MAFEHGVLVGENGAASSGQRLQPDCAATRPVNARSVNACHGMSYSMSGGRNASGEMAKMNKALKAESDMWHDKAEVKICEGKMRGRLDKALQNDGYTKSLEQPMAPIWAVHDESGTGQIPMTKSVRNLHVGDNGFASLVHEQGTQQARGAVMKHGASNADKLVMDHCQTYQLLNQTLQKSGSFHQTPEKQVLSFSSGHSVFTNGSPGVAAAKAAAIRHSQSSQAAFGVLSPASSSSLLDDGHASPASSRSGFSEPPNYAPRTPNPIVPTPHAALSGTVVHYGPPKPDKEHKAEHVAAHYQVQAQPIMALDHGVSAPLYLPVTMMDDPFRVGRSVELANLLNTPCGLPTLSNAMDPKNFPFVEAPRTAQAINRGVVKLKNIPFATKRCEVIAFLGRNSKILSDSEEPVHIIMERVTSKTMDAYIEFVNLEEAMKAVDKHQYNIKIGRVSRLGDRPIEVELSSQASLMKDLFPLARGLIWDGATPHIKPYNHQFAWENFRGFISEEEMVMLIKHVEVPHRSPYSKDCPQRPYECLISTLKKFPWYATESITISHRQALYSATERLVQVLMDKIDRDSDAINLNKQLQIRLINAALSCPGFTPLMKDNIAWMLNVSEAEQRHFGQPRAAYAWRHQYSLAPKPGVPLDVIEWYIAMIRDQTHRDFLCRPHAARTELQEKGEQTDMTWGYFWAELGHSFGPQFDQMTLAKVAHIEFSAVERILSRALPRT
ncbi:hypothetical protein CDD81_721 [Ophiocordyceps australis]|uniref:RRM domain-containing protein n=1 Tax=Ophiocordyceps australis TaxID=1399860 RepID=A0A2C5Y0H2_9HYPO|nr:hypothetical protein CDD81_721 [Ophiocordyceps australis]